MNLYELDQWLDIARLQSCYRSKEPQILKQLPNWKCMYRITGHKVNENLQPIPVTEDAPPKMEEKDEEEEEMTPILPGYRKEKPRPLPCWGRGVLRSPISDLPDFSGVEEVDRQGEIEAMRALNLGRGRGRARNRGAANIYLQSTVAPDVNMQNIQDQCQKYLGNWSRTENTQKKSIRSPRSQSMLSDPNLFLENTTSSKTVLPNVENNSFSCNSTEATFSTEINSDCVSITEELSRTNVIVEFSETPSPASTSEISYSNDISLQSSLSDVSHSSPFLERAESDSTKTEPNNSSNNNQMSDLMRGYEDPSHRNDKLSVNNGDQQCFSSPKITLSECSPSFGSTGSIKSSLSTIKNEDSFTLDSTPQKTSTTTSESYYSSCDSVQSSKLLSDRSESDLFVQHSSVSTRETKSANNVDNDGSVEQDSKANNENLLISYNSSTNSEVRLDSIPLVNKKNRNDLFLSSYSCEESDDSLSFKGLQSSSKKSSKKSKKNDFGIESRRNKNTFVPNIKNSVSSSSSVEENVTRKYPYVPVDKQRWDPTVEDRKGPTSWNLNQEFPRLSSSSSVVASGTGVMDNCKMEYLRTTAEFLPNKNHTGPTSESKNVDLKSRIGLDGILEVMSMAKETVADKFYRIKFDNIPLEVSRKDMELVLKEHTKVVSIILGTTGECQHAIVKCDRADLGDFFDGTAPFGSSVGDLRCRLL